MKGLRGLQALKEEEERCSDADSGELSAEEGQEGDGHGRMGGELCGFLRGGGGMLQVGPENSLFGDAVPHMARF